MQHGERANEELVVASSLAPTVFVKQQSVEKTPEKMQTYVSKKIGNHFSYLVRSSSSKLLLSRTVIRPPTNEVKEQRKTNQSVGSIKNQSKHTNRQVHAGAFQLEQVAGVLRARV